MPKKSKPISPEEVELIKGDPSVASIINAKTRKYEKNYRLRKLGFNNMQISAITGSTSKNVARDVWGFKAGRLRLAESLLEL